MEKVINSEEDIESMISNMGKYMITKLQKQIEKAKEKLLEVEKSTKKNKTEIEVKIKETIVFMTQLAEKTELQNKTQLEVIGLMENLTKTDEEIDSLLLKD
jgi:predicted  nucleic acid-binding Zn-ribbon protein